MMENRKQFLYKILTNNWQDQNIKEVKYLKIYKMKRQENLPHPFVKWAGGKRQLIPQMKKYFPEKFNKYIEPFVGGGAVFFFLYRNNLIYDNNILIDNNYELINCYNKIRDNVDQLAKSLTDHKNEEEYYYNTRKKDRNPEIYRKLTEIEKASRTIYLNKTCYNGLYRVNSKGEFNVPFGRYKNPNYCDNINLKTVSKALKNTKIIHGSFELCLNYAKEADLLYLDPPYHPLSQTSSFTGYTKEDFGINYQKKLYEVYKKLDKRGCKLMLSNSYSDFILNLYKDYNKIILRAKRAINCDSSKRGKIREILITNF